MLQIDQPNFISICKLQISQIYVTANWLLRETDFLENRDNDSMRIYMVLNTPVRFGRGQYQRQQLIRLSFGGLLRGVVQVQFNGYIT